MLTVIQDVRHAARLFRRSPGVSAVLLLTLAIGIGVNTAIFSFVDAILLKPLPYPHADRIVGMWERRPSGQANAMTAFNYLDFGGPFDDIREHAAVYVSNEEDSRGFRDIVVRTALEPSAFEPALQNCASSRKPQG